LLPASPGGGRCSSRSCASLSSVTFSPGSGRAAAAGRHARLAMRPLAPVWRLPVLCPPSVHSTYALVARRHFSNLHGHPLPRWEALDPITRRVRALRLVHRRSSPGTSVLKNRQVEGRVSRCLAIRGEERARVTTRTEQPAGDALLHRVLVAVEDISAREPTLVQRQHGRVVVRGGRCRRSIVVLVRSS
jgi:hypothetical protein